MSGDLGLFGGTFNQGNYGGGGGGRGPTNSLQRGPLDTGVSSRTDTSQGGLRSSGGTGTNFLSGDASGNLNQGNALVGGIFGSDSPAFAYERSRAEQESSTRPDPLTQEASLLRFNQLQDIINATGGLAGLYGPESNRLFQLNPQAQDALQRAITQSQMPGLTPEDWYRRALAQADPTASINAAQDVLGNIITPQLQGQYAQMGLGRSGGLGEATALAGTQLALPIAQLSQQQRFAAATQLPNVDVALRQAEISRQFAGFQAADIPRQLEVANWQRQAQGLGSAFNLVPYVAGQDSASVSREYGNIISDLIGVAASLVGAYLGGGGNISLGGNNAGNAGQQGSLNQGVQLQPYAAPQAYTTPQALPTVPYPINPPPSAYPGPYQGTQPYLQ